MAGSLAWYVYTADNGTTFGVQLDEDRGSLAGAGFTALPANFTGTTLPKGTKMRYVNAVRTSGAGAGFRSDSFPCGTIASAIFTGATATWTANGISYSRSSARGESRRVPKSVNTGLVGTSNQVGGGTGST